MARHEEIQQRILAIITPHQIVLLARASGVLGLLTLTVLMVGPFQGLEQSFGLNDIAAHVIAFYGLTVIAFVVAPDRRRTDMAIMLLGFGVAIELVQAATGRSASVVDLLADAAGVTAAVVPGMVERLRRDVRRYPMLSYAEIRRMDRRQKRRVLVEQSTGAMPAPDRT